MTRTSTLFGYATALANLQHRQSEMSDAQARLTSGSLLPADDSSRASRLLLMRKTAFADELLRLADDLGLIVHPTFGVVPKEPKKVEYMAFPRLTALAEAVWTPIDRKDYAGFRARLETHLARLSALDVNVRRPEP